VSPKHPRMYSRLQATRFSSCGPAEDGPLATALPNGTQFCGPEAARGPCAESKRLRRVIRWDAFRLSAQAEASAVIHAIRRRMEFGGSLARETNHAVQSRGNIHSEQGFIFPRSARIPF
jgi:hypothetical protein